MTPPSPRPVTTPAGLIISFPKHSAWITRGPRLPHVHLLSPTDEDMEGSFGPDILIGNHKGNAMLGQPGKDIFIGNGGDDVIDARDGVKDDSIQCGRGHPRVPAIPATKTHKRIPPIPATGRPEGRALIDKSDPTPLPVRRRSPRHPRPRPERLNPHPWGEENPNPSPLVTLWVTNDDGLDIGPWPNWRRGSMAWSRRASWSAWDTGEMPSRRRRAWDGCIAFTEASTWWDTRRSPGTADAWRRF